MKIKIPIRTVEVTTVEKEVEIDLPIYRKKIDEMGEYPYIVKEETYEYITEDLTKIKIHIVNEEDIKTCSITSYEHYEFKDFPLTEYEIGADEYHMTKEEFKEKLKQVTDELMGIIE